ncbi:MAG: hypothetical protein LBM66_01130 [Bifidobacteriaceae bacterium]|jgi:hypothetical protein|nr:hypothetical protein [Bifidobacteriaceae bacterium]
MVATPGTPVPNTLLEQALAQPAGEGPAAARVLWDILRQCSQGYLFLDATGQEDKLTAAGQLDPDAVLGFRPIRLDSGQYLQWYTDPEAIHATRKGKPKDQILALPSLAVNAAWLTLDVAAQPGPAPAGGEAPAEPRTDGGLILNRGADTVYLIPAEAIRRGLPPDGTNAEAKKLLNHVLEPQEESTTQGRLLAALAAGPSYIAVAPPASAEAQPTVALMPTASGDPGLVAGTSPAEIWAIDPALFPLKATLPMLLEFLESPDGQATSVILNPRGPSVQVPLDALKVAAGAAAVQDEDIDLDED